MSTTVANTQSPSTQEAKVVGPWIRGYVYTHTKEMITSCERILRGTALEALSKQMKDLRELKVERMLRTGGE